MQPNPVPLPCPVGSAVAVAVGDLGKACAPVSERVAALLRPIKTVPRYRDGEYDGDTEIWSCRPVTLADVPDLRRQLALVESAMRPGDVGAVLARIHGLLAHYRCNELPEAVERAVVMDWLEDVGGEFPESVVAEACRRWRRGAKMKFKPMPGEIREICVELLGSLPTMAERLGKLLASAPKTENLESTGSRAADVRSRVIALAAARKMP